LVVFTRVGSVKGGPTIGGDTVYLEVGTVSSVVKLFLARNCRPGNVVLSIEWGSNQFKSFEHWWRRKWSCGLERCL